MTLTLTIVMVILVLRTNLQKSETVPEESKVRRNETDIGFLIKDRFTVVLKESCLLQNVKFENQLKKRVVHDRIYAYQFSTQMVSG